MSPTKRVPRKAAAPPQETTGPSSEPVAPVVTMGKVTAPVVRTGVQVLSGTYIVQGIELWDLYHFTDAQRDWTVIGLTALLAWVLNAVEKVKGRRLIGSPT